MNVFLQIVVGFIICFSALVMFVARRDDDISDTLLIRKPTGDEAIRRLLYVLARAGSAASGGYILAIILIQTLIRPLGLIPAEIRENHNKLENITLLIIVSCCIVVLLFLRVLQNGLRKVQGRRPRPWIDFATFKHNLTTKR